MPGSLSEYDGEQADAIGGASGGGALGALGAGGVAGLAAFSALRPSLSVLAGSEEGGGSILGFSEGGPLVKPASSGPASLWLELTNRSAAYRWRPYCSATAQIRAEKRRLLLPKD
jgi:hypothetical protein